MRTAVASLLAIVACLVLPVALVAAWTAHEVTDTGGFVAATAPLATDPVVRREVSRRLVVVVEGSVPRDRAELFAGSGALGRTVVEQAVAGALRGAVFARTWTAATRAAHAPLLAGLRGDADAGRVTLDLAPVLAGVTDELVGYGLPVGAVPPGATRVTLVTGSRLAPAQRAYGVLDTVGYRGAVLWVGLVVAALLVSRSRRRTTGLLAWGTVLSAGAGLVAVLLGRTAAIAAVPAADQDLVRAVAAVLTSSLQRSLVVTAVTAAALGVAVLLLGLVRPRR